MTVTKHDVFVFYDGEKAEKAVEKMRRAIGKKNETQAAVKFARSMLALLGEREAIEDEGDRRRFDLLYAYYKIHAVKNKLYDVINFATELAGKVYNEYTSLGGNYLEEEAYRTNKTIEEVNDKRKNERPQLSIDTRKANVNEEIKKADEAAPEPEGGENGLQTS
jgi:hypothetical protein